VVEEDQVGARIVLKSPGMSTAVAIIKRVLGQLFELVGRGVGDGNDFGD
jgi:hypothetical protein